MAINIFSNCFDAFIWILEFNIIILFALLGSQIVNLYVVMHFTWSIFLISLTKEVVLELLVLIVVLIQELIYQNVALRMFGIYNLRQFLFCIFIFQNVVSFHLFLNMIDSLNVRFRIKNGLGPIILLVVVKDRLAIRTLVVKIQIVNLSQLLILNGAISLFVILNIFKFSCILLT